MEAAPRPSAKKKKLSDVDPVDLRPTTISAVWQFKVNSRVTVTPERSREGELHLLDVEFAYCLFALIERELASYEGSN